jgi:hypothetical protein
LMNRMNARIPGDYFIRDLATQEVVTSVHSTWGESESVAVKTSGPEPLFEIFCGIPDKNAKWYETVAGLANARIRMEQVARVASGAYFLFSPRDRSVIAVIDTTVTEERAIRSKKSAVA